MNRIILSVMIICLMTACNNKPSNDSQPVGTSPEHPPAELEQSVEEPSLAEPEAPVYIELGDYEGDQLEIVQLLNQRIQYLWGNNETDYLKLIQEGSPLNSFPSYKIMKISLLSEISIQEQNNVFQAKKDGVGWKIYDID
ncbi:hypothetical protein [Paenibacillus lemnae]|uniref:Lipoprotein n=1 Tax=Paenibacillus lemnae TaxID=1330551 RepID=A0A848M9T4_PAELE|nr:hypothetical protein [Paenibacillus lemnae]NMO97019.1 hypothetical protein [Paenibacillus lemnae]